MKKVILLLFLSAFSAASLIAAPRLVIDVGGAKNAPPDTLQGAVVYVPTTDSTAPRLVIDPSQLSFQFSMDSVMQAAEEKIRGLALQLEGKGDDAALERKIGELIGQILLEREMALLDLQILSATSLNDSLLLFGLRFALEELLRQNPQLQEMLLREALR